MIARRENEFVAATGRRTRRIALVLCAGLGLAIGGCAEELDVSYGGLSPRFAPASVNGTDVLAGMFTSAGYEVATRHVLIASNLDTVQTIVWFPDDYSAPSEEVCEWFDEWLAEQPGRTLVYVARGFDAAPNYLQKMLPLISKPQQDAYREIKWRIEARCQRRSRDDSRKLECEWFKIEPAATREIGKLAGPWSNGIDPAETEFELCDRLVPGKDARPLLSSDQDILAWRETMPDWDDGQLIMVANGSFLLNVPLVNHQHRILADKLIAEVAAPGRVVFLESGPGGPPIEPRWGGSALWRLLSAWPMGAILLQFAVLGIIFCFARWPIFGRPKVPAMQTTSDFGKHVEAVSQLLLRTKDRDYALQKLPDSLPTNH
jgi:hypothetical protein